MFCSVSIRSYVCVQNYISRHFKRMKWDRAIAKVQTPVNKSIRPAYGNKSGKKEERHKTIVSVDNAPIIREWKRGIFNLQLFKVLIKSWVTVPPIQPYSTSAPVAQLKSDSFHPSVHYLPSNWAQEPGSFLSLSGLCSFVARIHWSATCRTDPQRTGWASRAHCLCCDRTWRKTIRHSRRKDSFLDRKAFNLSPCILHNNTESCELGLGLQESRRSSWWTDWSPLSFHTLAWRRGISKYCSAPDHSHQHIIITPGGRGPFWLCWPLWSNTPGTPDLHVEENIVRS